MRILYIYRNPEMGISIGRVFRSIEQSMKQYCEVQSIYMPMNDYKPLSLWKNISYVQKELKNTHYDIIRLTSKVTCDYSEEASDC